MLRHRLYFDVASRPTTAPTPTCPSLACRQTGAVRPSFLGCFYSSPQQRHQRRTRTLHSSARSLAHEEDHYATLGVPETIDPAGLKRKFYALSKELHPDRNPGDEAATSRFQAVSAAYSVLSDPKTRREYDGKRRRTVMAQPAAPRGSYFSPGRNRHRQSDSDLNATRRARATYAWDQQANAHAKRARDRAEGAAKAASESGKGKGFRWGTGGVFEGRGMFPDDEQSHSRFEQLKEREQRMDATLKARVRAAQAAAARMSDMRLNDDSTSAHAWLFTMKQPMSPHTQRMDARERAFLFERTAQTREAYAAWKHHADTDIGSSHRPTNHFKVHPEPSGSRDHSSSHAHAHVHAHARADRNHRPPPIGLMQTFLISTAAVVVGSLGVFTIATGPLRSSFP